MSRSRRPYLPRYKTAFAFSDSPLPPPSSPFLAVGIPPRGGTSGAYPVVQCGDADGEAAPYNPVGHGATVVDGSNRRTDPRAILVPPVSTFGRFMMTDLNHGRSLAFSLPSSAGPRPDRCFQSKAVVPGASHVGLLLRMSG